MSDRTPVEFDVHIKGRYVVDSEIDLPDSPDVIAGRMRDEILKDWYDPENDDDEIQVDVKVTYG